MNIFVQILATDRLPSAPDLSPGKLVVEDNVGESIHVHVRNVRLEMSVDDFETFADHVVAARAALHDEGRD